MSKLLCPLVISAQPSTGGPAVAPQITPYCLLIMRPNPWVTDGR
jgi:hypothetical protein